MDEVAQSARLIAGRYELGRLLGSGGMSDVYLATDTKLGRRVAVKLLRSSLAAEPVFRTRFRQEAQAAARMAHPTIVRVFDAGEEIAVGPDGTETIVPFIVMEHIEGRLLKDIVAEGPLPLAEAVRVTEGILTALEYSHRAGVVHRDIKPGNMFIDGQGNLKVSDLGLALWAADAREQQAMERGLAVGTPHYMAPEQVMGKAEIDGRADLYALGCSIFHLATGSVPFKGTTPAEVQDQHLDAPVPDPRALRPDLPDDMADLATRLMSKDPARRGGRKA